MRQKAFVRMLVACATIFTMLVSMGTGFGALAQDSIHIVVNGTALALDQMPVMESDRVLVPMRGIFEALGAQVGWDDASQTVTGTLGDKTVVLSIGDVSATVNGSAVTLDVPARLVNDRTMVPVRFISESLGAQVDWDDASQTVTVTMEGGAAKTLVFDDLDSFEFQTDYLMGGGYAETNVTLSSDVDHTTGSGKSIKMADRGETFHRVKFKNLLTPADVGKSFLITCWMYLPDEDGRVALGVYGDSGTAHATEPAAIVKVDAKKGEWTKVSLSYTYTDETACLPAVEQGGSGVIETMYVDDISITVEERSDISLGTDGKRPVPTEFQAGKSMDDLIFYDEQVRPKGMKFEDLPKGEVVVSESDFVNASISGAEYYTAQKVAVDGMPFKEALRVTVNEVPPSEWTVQVNNNVNAKFEVGDVVLVVLYMRRIDGGHTESQTTKVQCIVESLSTNDKLIKGDLVAGNEWQVGYFPFEIRSGFESNIWAPVRLGYYEQTIEIGGYQMINFKKSVTLEDMPVSYNYDGILSDAAWRKDAIANIEKIRMGDMNVSVLDAAGNPVSGADVKVDMIEHAFQFGTAVSPTVIEDSVDGDKYRAAVSKYFNSAVPENQFKWAEYEKDPQLAGEMLDTLQDIGIKHLRGHCFVWDREYKEGITSMPADVPALMDDKEKLDARIKAHILSTGSAYDDKLEDWDVLNEFVVNQVMATKHGWGMIKDWFAWAREAAPSATLYINEYNTEQPGAHYNHFVEIVDYMVENGVDFDGIGLQTHVGTYFDPALFVGQLEDLATRYGKRLKITEYDNNIIDPYIQASHTRDMLIAAFANENVDGFYMWEFKDYNDTHNRALLNADWSVKPSGEQYIDLVYNKWWTREAGTTDASGAYSVRGYYGDYEITVTKDGVSKTVTATLEKGADNQVAVTLD